MNGGLHRIDSVARHKKARWKRIHISRKLYKPSKVINGKVCPIELRRIVESSGKRTLEVKKQLADLKQEATARKATLIPE